MPPASRWTAEDFPQMSWHDVHVHGVRVAAGATGTGTLSFDLDYIVEWTCGIGGRAMFRLAPATLAFEGVFDLRMTIDYAAATAAVAPFAIAEIRREDVEDGRVPRWTVALNWPMGVIDFRADGFTQSLRREPVLSAQQWLEPSERG